MALREILVHFGFDLDESKLKHAEHGVEHLVESIHKLGVGIGAAFVGHEIKEFFEETIEEARKLEQASIMYGLARQELQGLQHAAEMTDSSAEAATQGFRFLSRALNETKQGTKEYVKVFQQIGVSVKETDGQIRPTADVFLDIADHIQSMPEGAERAAVAMDLFGRNGAMLVPMLRKGSSALREYMGEVETLGGGLNDHFVEESEEVELAQKRLRFQWQSMRVALVTSLIPASLALMGTMQRLKGAFLELNKHVDIGKSLLVGLFGMMLTKLPMVIGGLTTFVRTSGLAVAKWALLWIVADDLFTLLSGGESQLGTILDKVFGEGAAESFVASVKYMFGSWEGFQDSLSQGLFQIGGIVVAVFLGVKATVTEALAYLADAWDRFVNSLHLPKMLTDFLGDSTNVTGRKHTEATEDRNRTERLALAEDIQSAASQWARNRDEAKYEREYEAADKVGEEQRHNTEIQAKKYAESEHNAHATPEGEHAAPAEHGAHGDARVGTTVLVDPTKMIASAPEHQVVSPAAQAPHNSTTNNHYEDKTQVNVTTLPATTATQAREVGRAARHGKQQAGTNLRALHATEHVPE